jgi:hypothetical protein
MSFTSETQLTVAARSGAFESFRVRYGCPFRKRAATAPGNGKAGYPTLSLRHEYLAKVGGSSGNGGSARLVTLAATYLAARRTGTAEAPPPEIGIPVPPGLHPTAFTLAFQLRAAEIMRHK